MAISFFVYLAFLVFISCASAKYEVVEVTLAEAILGFRVAKVGTYSLDNQYSLVW